MSRDPHGTSPFLSTEHSGRVPLRVPGYPNFTSRTYVLVRSTLRTWQRPVNAPGRISNLGKNHFEGGILRSAYNVLPRCRTLIAFFANTMHPHVQS